MQEAHVMEEGIRGEDMRVALLEVPLSPSETDVDQQCGGCVSKLRASGSGKSRKSLLLRACCLCLVFGSVLANLVLGAALMLMMNSDESYSPLPPPTPNSSNFECPFGPSSPQDNAQVALTGLGSDYVSLCWNDFARNERGALPEPYRVNISDAWTSTDELVASVSMPMSSTVYQGRASSFNATELLPASQYRITVFSDKNGASQSKSLDVVTHDRGFCGNAADVQAYKKTKKTMKPGIQACLIKHILDDDAIATCINDSIGLSIGCSKCWVAEAHCTIKYCASACMNPTSKKCQDCSEEKCFPDCVKCSGMPQWSFPL